MKLLWRIGAYFVVWTSVACAVLGHERDRPWNPDACRRCLRDPRRFRGDPS